MINTFKYYKDCTKFKTKGSRYEYTKVILVGICIDKNELSHELASCNA